MKTIALTSPTGKIGTALRAAARARNAPLIPLARNPERLAGDNARGFDFADPSTFDRALAGIDTLVLITPSDPHQAEQEIAIAEAAQTAGAQHIIKLSVQGVDAGAIAVARLHQTIEAHLATLRIPATMLRPTFFMDNALGLASAISAGVFPSPMGNAKIGQIDVRDIAEVALTVASSPDVHEGRAYTLTGPAAYTGEEIAIALAAASGHPVRYVDLDDAAFRAELEKAGAGPWYRDVLSELYDTVRAGATAELSGDVHALLGRAPRSFEQFATDHAAAFRAAAPV